ncbi:hypothetical protein I3760_15G032300 [Carya illinoinensis]|nr:hypothetical protein I3760_15G032300 [Carya illinoinensis]
MDDSTLAYTLLDMQSSHKEKKKFKGKTRMNPYSRLNLTSLGNSNKLKSQVLRCLPLQNENISLELQGPNLTQGNQNLKANIRKYNLDVGFLSETLVTEDRTLPIVHILGFHNFVHFQRGPITNVEIECRNRTS